MGVHIGFNWRPQSRLDVLASLCGLQYLPFPEERFHRSHFGWGPIYLVLGIPCMCGYSVLHVSSVDSILMFLYPVLEAASCLPNVDWVTVSTGISYTAPRLHSFGVLLLIMTFIRVCLRVLPKGVAWLPPYLSCASGICSVLPPADEDPRGRNILLFYDVTYAMIKVDYHTLKSVLISYALLHSYTSSRSSDSQKLNINWEGVVGGRLCRSVAMCLLGLAWASPTYRWEWTARMRYI